MTPKQKRLLDFIRAHIASHEFSPTFDEMLVGVGAASKSNIHRMVEGLIAEGHLRRLVDRARGLEVIDRGGRAAGLIGSMTASALKDHGIHDDFGEDSLIVFTEPEFRRFLIKHLETR